MILLFASERARHPLVALPLQRSRTLNHTLHIVVRVQRPRGPGKAQLLVLPQTARLSHLSGDDPLSTFVSPSAK